MGDNFTYETKKCDVEYFVGVSRSGKADEQQQAFVTFLQAALKSAKNEKQLQDALFSAMNTLDSVTMMEESRKKQPAESNRNKTREQKEKKKAEEKRFREFVDGAKNYVKDNIPFLSHLTDLFFDNFVEVAEHDTKNLLDTIATKYLQNICGNPSKMKEAGPAIFVKTSSRPDIVALVGAGEQNDILFSEAKNDSIYSFKDAIEQEVCYLLLLLYWWRVICGRDVERVFGFTFCGPRCDLNSARKLGKRKRWFDLGGQEDAQYYHLALIEVTIPEKLGQLNTAKIREERCNLDSQDGLNILYRFMTNQELWKNVVDAKEVEPNSAAWMTLPRNSLAVSAGAKTWELVPGGTSAVVIRCQGRAGLQSFLESGIVDPDLVRRATKYWLNDEIVDDESTYYVKVKTKATERDFAQDPPALWNDVNDFKNEEKKLCRDFLTTYPLAPLKPKGITISYAVFMRHRGSVRLDRSDFLGKLTSDVQFAQFAKKLLDLWNKTVKFSEYFKICHGDVAPFNILLDESENNSDESENNSNESAGGSDDLIGEFVLIDWDESALPPKARHVADLRNEIKHHEALRLEPLLYTDVQFALTYCEIRNRYENKEWNIFNEESLKGFRNAIGSQDEARVFEEAQKFVKAVKTEMASYDDQYPKFNTEVS